MLCIIRVTPSQKLTLILDRYIIREISRPMLLGLGLLVLVFTGYSTAIKLADAAAGLIDPSTVAKLAFLNTLIALEVLLPTALYLSVISALGRLYRDSEIAALQASGIGDNRLLKAVIKLALVVAVIVATISIFGRPWAYKQTYQIESEAAAGFTIDQVEPERFLDLHNNQYVLFAKRVDTEKSILGNVFMQGSDGDKSKVIYAKEARLLPTEPGEQRVIEFKNGYSYLFDNTGSKDVSLKFGSLTMRLEENKKAAAYRRKATSTQDLMTSKKPKEIAEFQWRLSTPFATLLLAMLAVPLSRSAPRQSRHWHFIIAILVYIAFFNLSGMARNWLEQGKVGAFPGMWWIYVVAGIVFILLYTWPRLKRLNA